MRDIKGIGQLVKENAGIKPREIMLILIPGCRLDDPIKAVVRKRLYRLKRDGDVKVEGKGCYFALSDTYIY